MPMTPEEIASCLRELKEKTALKDAKIKLSDDTDEVDLLQAFLNDPGTIKIDGRIENIIKNKPYKKMALYAHPDRHPFEDPEKTGKRYDDSYMRAVDEYTHHQWSCGFSKNLI